jgi:hypothetical protein
MNATQMRPTTGLPVAFATVKGAEIQKVATQTIGSIFLLPRGDNQLVGLDAGHVRILAALFPCASASPPCAYGKIGLLDLRRLMASSWQASPERAERCACGNLCAGLVATAGIRKRTRNIRLSISISDTAPEAQVDGTLASHPSGGWLVEQRWKVAPPSNFVLGTTRDGRSCARVSWLNEYAVVCGDGEIAPETLRQELTGGGHRGKLIIVTNAGPILSARIFNSNGEHPGIPMTGLITLSWLGRDVDWLAPLRVTRTINYQHGAATLPQLSVTGEGVSFTMPTAHVVLRHHAAKGNRP